MFPSRLNKMLQLFLEKDDYILVSELSTLLQISKRTVFREVQNSDIYLDAYQLKLISTQKKGLKLIGDDESKKKLQYELSSQVVQYVNKEERKNLLIFELLRIDERMKLYYYATLFQVSEATISNDLDEVASWFASYGLAIIRKPGIGVELMGEEKNYRRALTAILNKAIYTSEDQRINLNDATSVLKQIFIHKNKSIMKLLNQDILKRILHVFQQYRHELSLDRYAQSSYIGLIIHLTIAIDRILKKEEIEDNNIVVDMMKDDVSLLQAKKMAHYLEIEFSIVMPEVEQAFIAMHIKGAKLTNIQEQEGLYFGDISEKEIMLLIDEMLFSLKEPYASYLQKDQKLIQGLIAHLRPTLIRMKYHLPIFNPLLEDIKKMYLPIYERAELAANVIEHHFNYKVNDDEVGYLAMHLGAAMERYHQGEIEQREIHVGIVCSSGIGVSALLLARIQKLMDENVILETLSMKDVQTKNHSCKLLVSTFMFESTIEKVMVNPLLTQQDMKQIQEAIQRKRREQCVPTTKQVDNYLNRDELVERITQVLEQVEVIHVSFAISKQSLLTCIVEVVSKDKKIQENLLIKLEQREIENTSVYHELGFALFHTTCDGLEHITYKIFRPSASVFTDINLEGIHFAVAMFMPSQNTKHSKQILSEISRKMIDDAGFYKTLQQGTSTSVYNEVERILKDFLFDTLTKRGCKDEL